MSTWKSIVHLAAAAVLAGCSVFRGDLESLPSYISVGAGIVRVEGRFGIGDPVACVDARGREIARGLAAYTAGEVERIKGLSTKEALRVLGYSNGDEVIHRDDLVLLEPRRQGAGTRG